MAREPTEHPARGLDEAGEENDRKKPGGGKSETVPPGAARHTARREHACEREPGPEVRRSQTGQEQAGRDALSEKCAGESERVCDSIGDSHAPLMTPVFAPRKGIAFERH